jgi:hypothetical protein
LSKYSKLLIPLGAAIILVLLAACKPADTSLDFDELLGDVATAEEETPTVVENTPIEEPSPLTSTPDMDENCVDCHANQELLQALATEAEEGESLSEGEG